MKKALIILSMLVAGGIIVLLVLLPERAQDAEKLSGTAAANGKIHRLAGKKQAVISEIDESDPFPELAGTWIIFIHHADSTKSCEVTFNAQGQAVDSSCPQTENLAITTNGTGCIRLQNNSISMEGYLDEKQSYLKGSVRMGGYSSPIPFSARKISAPAAEGAVKK